MSFKWPSLPTPRAHVNELADYAEMLCWQRGAVSAVSLERALGRVEEYAHDAGVVEEDEIPSKITDVYLEIEQRSEFCGEGYPFQFSASGRAIRRDPAASDQLSAVYEFLLLATRLNMSDNRTHGGFDGTQLFERLGAEVARDYFGKKAESVVFGTASGSQDFPGRIDGLCRRLGEGVQYVDRFPNARRRKDDKLDVVAWKSFNDRRASKLIGFGQCKTGTYWRDDLEKLRPDTFCEKWFHTSLSLDPIRMFFVCEAVSDDTWGLDAKEGGLLFDRCRIVEFSHSVDDAVLNELVAWTASAASSEGLTTP